MTDNITPFPTKPHVENYFGGCPTCGKTDGYVNEGADHWFICKDHGFKWYIGSNLFSSWTEETEEEQARGALTLAGLTEVKSIDPCDHDPCPECRAKQSAPEIGAARSPEDEAAVGRLVDFLFTALPPEARVRNFARERSEQVAFEPFIKALQEAADEVGARPPKPDDGPPHYEIGCVLLNNIAPRTVVSAEAEGIGSLLRIAVAAWLKEHAISPSPGEAA